MTGLLRSEAHRDPSAVLQKFVMMPFGQCDVLSLQQRGAGEAA